MCYLYIQRKRAFSVNEVKYVELIGINVYKLKRKSFKRKRNGRMELF